ncbi:hypothetical protein J437_LFUL019144 [Ladona fulva]|uniref:PiggyBac transposable element-derived protein domain-containing protein n=1 Tax=Ladona fulva TaxID=123851 RepID=A0A8K0KQS1_LADFU|nr:hypothetical protein J437_LFUL019144 [Ladona fulva]
MKLRSDAKTRLLSMASEEIYHHTTIETNRNGKKMPGRKGELSQRSRLNKWEDVSANEMRAIVGVVIEMGLVHKFNVANYFNDKFWLTITPGFSCVFNRDQYTLICSFLHFADISKKYEEDRLYKIRPMII